MHDLTFAAVQSGYAVTLYLQPSQKKACIGRSGVSFQKVSCKVCSNRTSLCLDHFTGSNSAPACPIPSTGSSIFTSSTGRSSTSRTGKPVANLPCDPCLSWVELLECLQRESPLLLSLQTPLPAHSSRKCDRSVQALQFCDTLIETCTDHERFTALCQWRQRSYQAYLCFRRDLNVVITIPGSFA